MWQDNKLLDIFNTFGIQINVYMCIFLIIICKSVKIITPRLELDQEFP